MTYEDIILEEANQLLVDGPVLLEASRTNRRHSNGPNNNNKGPEPGFFEKAKAGNFIPFSGSPTVKKMVAKGALKPYGFQNVDITDTNKLRQVMASIKRRRDVEAARAMVVGTIEAVAACLFGGIGQVAGNIASNPDKYGTAVQPLAGGASEVFKIMSVVTAAVALFTEVVNMVDVVKATKEIGQVRANIMNAYDKVNTKIMNTKPAGANLKEIENYNAMLNYRDMLRECQIKLGSIGGFGADAYVAGMRP